LPIEHIASDFLSLIIFIVDGFLKESSTQNQSNLSKFIQIMLKLPVELQMLLVRKIVGLDNNFIKNETLDQSFQKLYRLYC